MIEPNVQYAMTTDGVSIAYSTMGEGRPLLFLVGPGLPSHVESSTFVSGSDLLRKQKEGLARSRMQVSLDLRGQGASDSEVGEYSLEAYLSDVEAVVSRLGASEIDIFAIYTATPIAIAYAARHPTQVAHLILWNAVARFATPPLENLTPALKLLLETDWVTFTELLARTGGTGWEEGRGAGETARIMRESTTPERFKAQLEAVGRFDVTAELASVACPTLVLHRRELPGRRRARSVAAAIPDGRLVTLEGSSPTTFIEGVDALLRAVDDFLGAPPREAAGVVESPPPPGGGLQTILFTDVEGSTDLTDRLGDAAARELLRAHEQITREALKAHGGSEVKTMGDGFMASFGSATKALECAIAVQREMGNEKGEMGDGVRVRIGLNAGEPIAEDDPDGRSDLFGTAVIVAARIAAQAKGGEILVSDVVRQLVAGKGFLFNDRGEHALKGFEDPVRVWEVRWSESG